MTEEWRVVPSYPDYEASNLGRVRRATPGKGTRVGKILATPPDSGGYPTIGTRAHGPLRVHVLVAEAFHGQIPKGGQVHHENENRADARPSNLTIKPSSLAHRQEHRKSDRGKRRHGEANPTILCACGCGRSFPKYDASNRPRRYVSGHNTGERNREGVVGSRG